LVNDPEYSKSAGTKPVLSPGCIYLVSSGARALLLLLRQLRIFAATAAGECQNKTSSGVNTLICVCTRKASGSTEDSRAGTQPQNLVGRGRHCGKPPASCLEE
jgi:hypothetical protein